MNKTISPRNIEDNALPLHMRITGIWQAGDGFSFETRDDDVCEKKPMKPRGDRTMAAAIESVKGMNRAGILLELEGNEYNGLVAFCSEHKVKHQALQAKIRRSRNRGASQGTLDVNGKKVLWKTIS